VDPEQPQFRYRAFISYSHADEAWAKWLHKALETYRVPKRLVGRETAAGAVPERLAPVFRDRDELATATSLGETLTRALQESACQLVICSPKAAQSRWVNEEIRTFKRLGRSHRIFALVVSGEPGGSSRPELADQECFPPALLFEIEPDGALSDRRTEPIAADVRSGKDSKQDARLKLIAGLLDVGLDELKQREAARRHRRMAWLAAASIAGMAITSGLAGAAWLARNEAERQRARAEAEAETARQTTRFMVDLFKVSDPSEALGNTITAREILDKGAARIDRELAGQPAIQATLMDTMGTVYTSLGLYDAAVPLVRKAYERRLQLWGPDHGEVANSLNHLGEVLTLKSDYAQAERSLRDALAVQRRVHGPQSDAAAQSLTLLADVLRHKGDLAGAEAAIKEALAIRRRLHGNAPNGDVAVGLETLGIVYTEAGRYDDAVEAMREVAAMQRKLHPAAHPDVARAMDNLSNALMNVGRPDEAEPLSRLAVSTYRLVYGEDHPATATGLNNLAYVLEARERYAEAESTYRSALEINRRLLGPRHPTVSLMLSNIAYVQYARGNQSEAIATMRESYAIAREALGPEHADVASRAAALGQWLLDAGKPAEARDMIRQARDIRRKALGEQHPAYLNTLALEANLALTEGDPARAQALGHEARVGLEQSLPAGSWQIANAMSVEGAALVRLGRYTEAEPLLRDSLAGLAKAPVPRLAERGRERLAELYEKSGRSEDARKLRERG
jgi:tetratricopeptide (TPR) repeat protein